MDGRRDRGVERRGKGGRDKEINTKRDGGREGGEDCGPVERRMGWEDLLTSLCRKCLGEGSGGLHLHVNPPQSPAQGCVCSRIQVN